MNSEKIKKYVGAKIRQMRIDAGLDQEDISKLLKLHRVSILNIEQGRHGLKYESLLKLCELFNCTYNDILPPPQANKFLVEKKTINVKKTVNVIRIVK